jgi:hypothetical protein
MRTPIEGHKQKTRSIYLSLHILRKVRSKIESTTVVSLLVQNNISIGAQRYYYKVQAIYP